MAFISGAVPAYSGPSLDRYWPLFQAQYRPIQDLHWIDTGPDWGDTFSRLSVFCVSERHNFTESGLI
jgi:hypothetical protein